MAKSAITAITRVYQPLEGITLADSNTNYNNWFLKIHLNDSAVSLRLLRGGCSLEKFHMHGDEVQNEGENIRHVAVKRLIQVLPSLRRLQRLEKSVTEQN